MNLHLILSQDFGEHIVYPLVALFFGTGNQTPFISSAILERVFMDPNMRLVSQSFPSPSYSHVSHADLTLLVRILPDFIPCLHPLDARVPPPLSPLQNLAV